MPTLNQILAESDSPPLAPGLTEKFTAYLQLLQRWNQKTNLTSIRDDEGILRRHFVESILCAQNLPANIATLLDYGSGAGFPGIPIALVRPGIDVTLAESQNKKAAFLREVVRTLDLQTKVHSGRAEQLTTHYECITLRAVDHMELAIPAAIQLLSPNGWLAIMTTTSELQSIQQAASELEWHPPLPLPATTTRRLLLGKKS